MITGFSLSCTVTVEVHVAVLPLKSVTVRVTIFAPTLAQVNAFGEAENEAMPQLSVEPPSMSVPVIDALPVASKFTSMFLHIATGFSSSVTFTLKLHVETLFC